jgi:hypothetical protein
MVNSHLPFKNEYLRFVAHLRGLAGSSPISGDHESVDPAFLG